MKKSEGDENSANVDAHRKLMSGGAVGFDEWCGRDGNGTAKVKTNTLQLMCRVLRGPPCGGAGAANRI